MNDPIHSKKHDYYMDDSYCNHNHTYYWYIWYDKTTSLNNLESSNAHFHDPTIITNTLSSRINKSNMDASIRTNKTWTLPSTQYMTRMLTNAYLFTCNQHRPNTLFFFWSNKLHQKIKHSPHQNMSNLHLNIQKSTKYILFWPFR